MGRYPKLVGYAAAWMAVGQTPKDGYYKRFAAGAFGHSSDFQEVKALWQHNYSLCLASNGYGRRSGSVNLREDGYGLAFEVQPDEDCDWIDRVISYIRAGTVRGVSTGHEPLEGRVDRLASGLVVHTILRARLVEISPIYDPLFRETSVRVAEPGAETRPAASPRAYGERYSPGGRFAPRTLNHLAVNC